MSEEKVQIVRNLLSELAFWRWYFRAYGCSSCNPSRWKEVFPTRLLPFIEEAQARRDRQAKLLELGPGPVSLLAWGVEEDLFELTAVDPLARQYASLLRQNGCSYPVSPRYGVGENLSATFSASAFDLAYSSNALDHTVSPRRTLEELARVVHVGGIIYSEGFVREGTNSAWQGLHQHDLVPESRHLARYGRDGSRISLAEGLPLEPIYECVETLAERSIESHGYEWDENENRGRDWRSDDWYTFVFRVGQAEYAVI
jgi:SAM-dependent methyltransferase